MAAAFPLYTAFQTKDARAALLRPSAEQTIGIIPQRNIAKMVQRQHNTVLLHTAVEHIKPL
jgi:hypothetical protein